MLVEPLEDRRLLAVVLTATKDVDLRTANTGDTLTYEVDIANTGNMDATNVTFADTLVDSTLVAGSIRVTPIAFDDDFVVFGNVGLTETNPANGLLANDFDPDNPTATPGAGLTVASPGAAPKSGGTTTGNGSLNINSDGTFTYSPPAGETGTETFTYTVRDSHNLDSNVTASVEFTINNLVWFVDNSVTSPGTGTLADPFNDFSQLNGGVDVDADGDVIFVFEGGSDYNIASGFDLENNQVLIGEGLALVLGGQTVVAAGNRPTLASGSGNSIDLASGNMILGLNIGGSGNSGLSGSNITGGTIDNVSISTTGATGIDITGSTGLTFTFDSLTVNGAGSNDGINLDNNTGSFTFTTVDITNSGGSGIDINNSGSVTIGGGSVNASPGAGTTGIDITGNAAASSFTFSSVDITGTTGGGINVNASGTINITGAGNTISTTTGTPVNISNTTIGASGITFESIAANGAANGIILNSTGSGSFTVVGDGTTTRNSSGGVLQNISGHVVDLDSASNVTLNHISIQNAADHAVDGVNVVNFGLNHSLLNNIGNADNENALHFVGSNGVTGTLTINNTSITNYFENALEVDNQSGTLSATISNSTINDNDDTFGVDALFFAAEGSARINVDLTNSTFDNTEGDIFHFQASSSVTTHDINVIGNTSTNGGGPDNAPIGGGGITIIGTQGGFTFDIQGNTLTDAGDAVTVSAIGNIQGRIGGPNASDGNTITNDAGDGVFIDFGSGDDTNPSTGNGTFLIQNNTITNPGDDGINLQHRDNTGTFQVTVRDNSISDAGVDGIRLFTDEDSGSATPVNTILIADNTINGTGLENAGFGEGMRFRVRDDRPVTLNLTLTDNVIMNPGNPNTCQFASSICVQSTGTGNVVRINATGNNNGGAGNLDVVGLEEQSGAMSISQASIAAFSTANDNATVNPSTGVTFGAVVPTPSLPTHSLRALPLPTTTDVVGADVGDGDYYESTPDADAATDSAIDGPATPAAPLTMDVLQPVIDAAIVRWADAGATDAQLAVLESVEFEIVDLADTNIGAAWGTNIQIDADAGGWTWYVDSTPLDDSEFANTLGDTWLSTDGGDADRQMDLLTTVMHELGHTLGLDDLYSPADAGNLMAGLLMPGQRRLPADGLAVGAVAGSIHNPHFIGAPIDIGTLPAGKSVTITFQAVVDNPFTGTVVAGLGQLTNQGQVASDQLATFNTDDPDTAAPGDATLTEINVNQPPVANPGGPYTTSEGSGISLDGSGSSDPDGDPLTITWDINNDGNFSDASGATPSLTWAQLVALGLNDGLNPGVGLTIGVRVTDGTDETDAFTTLTINNTAPTAALTGPTVADINDPVTFTFSATDPSPVDQAANMTYTINWGDGSPVQNVAGPASGVNLNHAFVLNGLLTVSVTATDKDGGTGAAATQQIDVNAPPVPNAGGPYTISEGDGLSLDGSGTVDPDGDTLTISWDINNDGNFSDASGPTPSLTWAQLVTLGLNDGLNPGVATTVGVRVNDGRLTEDAFTSLTINNTAPTAALAGPATGVRGEPVTFTFSATDPSPVDQAANMTYAINWGDGSPVQSVVGPAGGVNVAHTYTVDAAYTVSVTATHKDNGTSAAATQSIDIDPVGVVGGNLVVGGTDGRDRIIVSKANAADSFFVRINRRRFGPLLVPPPGQIIINAQGGNDVVSISGRIDRDTQIDGGTGNDRLYGAKGDDTMIGGEGNDLMIAGRGGSNTLDGGDDNDRLVGSFGNDILLGGAGNDLLLGSLGDDILDGGEGNDRASGGLGDDLIRGGGGHDTISGGFGNDILIGNLGNDNLNGAFGRDILIGGGGRDSLRGGFHDDILTGGSSSYDSPSAANDAALRAILAEWTSSGAFNDRVNNIKTGGGLTGGNTLSAGTTILDDGDPDTLRGDSGQDWFFAFADRVRDARSGDLVE